MAETIICPGSSFRSLGHNQMVVNSTTKTLTNGATYTIPVETVIVRVQPESANIRYRHSTAPTANTGNIIYAGDVEWIPGVISDIQLIREGGSDATVNVDFRGFKA